MSSRPSFTKSSWSWPNGAWNFLLALSFIGIWPRFIEPILLRKKRFYIDIENLDPSLENLSIIQLSDLHIQPITSKKFLNRVQKAILSQKPDLIVFTGDFICQSHLLCKENLLHFLKPLKGKLGSFAVLGNHDYEKYVGIDPEGNYSIKEGDKSNPIQEGLKRIYCKLPKLTGKFSPHLDKLKPHQELISLLNETPFQLLHNETATLGSLNITGLGEYSANDFFPEKAFTKDPSNFQLVLMHNPDGVLKIDKPLDLVLSGHTHGGQINLPLLWKRFTRIENEKFKVGFIKLANKRLFVNRGLGAILPIRLFSPPEIVTFILRRK